MGILNVGWYCVALFFFFSGWGIAFGYKNKKEYMRMFLYKRLPKIIIPFFSAHVIYFIVKSIKGIQFNFFDIIEGMLGNCNIVDNSWYPVSIIIFYIVFWAIFSRYTWSRKTKLMSLVILIGIITFIEILVVGKKQDWWFISNFAFVLGVVIQMYDPEFKYWKQYIFYGILAYGIGYVLIPVCAMITGSYYYGIYVLAANLRSASITLLTILIVLFLRRKSKIMEILGAYSYEIYLMHGLFIWLFNSVCSIANMCLLLIFVIGCTVPCAIILNYIDQFWIKKIDKKICKHL